MSTMTRAQLLRGNWHDNSSEIRPPWALSGVAFTGNCDGCGDCISACPQGVLRLTTGNLPEVNFSAGRCTFCGDCADACKPGALSRRTQSPEQPWQVRANITDQCLAIQGTSCVRCIESCEEDAIVARPALRGRTRMYIEGSACTGCGACFAPCPVSAINLRDMGALKAAENLSARSTQ